ncbi:MAG: hypothetical protein EP312_07765 [Gammaproteobacteria bacterium]|nr:MAG: hypothetical protein EP312_07765 [Gammaproteobacteria bacterium]
MLKVLRKTRTALQAMALSALLVIPSMSHAASPKGEDTPTMLSMVTDVVAVRPVMFVTTIVGSVAFVVALPFSAAGGNIKETADVLVVGPALTTFVRPVGHPFPGYKKD